VFLKTLTVDNEMFFLIFYIILDFIQCLWISHCVCFCLFEKKTKPLAFYIKSNDHLPTQLSFDTAVLHSHRLFLLDVRTCHLQIHLLRPGLYSVLLLLLQKKSSSGRGSFKTFCSGRHEPGRDPIAENHSNCYFKKK